MEMDAPISNLTGARATLFKLAEGCDDDSELQDALFFLAIKIAADVAELRKQYDLACDLKRAEAGKAA
jgi:hypothetical protein